MFKYVIFGHGCNGAGETEEWIEYRGTNREEAIAGYKRAKSCMGLAYADITVIGREWQKKIRLQTELDKELEEEADRESDFGPDILEYTDGYLVFEDDDPPVELYLEHGNVIERYDYREYNRSIGVFSESGKFHNRIPESIRFIARMRNSD